LKIDGFSRCSALLQEHFGKKFIPKLPVTQQKWKRKYFGITKSQFYEQRCGKSIFHKARESKGIQKLIDKRFKSLLLETKIKCEKKSGNHAKYRNKSISPCISFRCLAFIPIVCTLVVLTVRFVLQFIKKKSHGYFRICLEVVFLKHAHLS